MAASYALVTGAGISADAPASLPLGRAFDDRLLQFCAGSAARLAPGSVDAAVVAGVAARRNLLSRLAGCVDRDCLDALLDCFRVTVPTEAHMLAAAHAVHGALHVTLNFDDGVERAYRLLARKEELPSSVPSEYQDALRAWREAVPTTAPLTVLPPESADVGNGRGPTLVKLRGSVGTGFAPQLLRVPAATRESDLPALSEEQMSVLRAAARLPRLIVAGVSGADVDCRDGLVPLLSWGRFTWTAAEIPPEVVRLLNEVDPAQPVLRPALDGLRMSLPADAQPPAWPHTPLGRPRFAEAFAAWCRRVPETAAAEAFAWLLYDAGVSDRAVPILRAVQARLAHRRTRRLLAAAEAGASRDTGRAP